MDWPDDMIKGKILHKLSRHGKFQHSHTAIEHLQTGLLLMKRTNYGEQVSVNVHLPEQVMQYIESFLKRRE